MAKLLQVENLQTEFLTSAGVVRAVDGVTWDVDEGETVALVGESGCGKSVSALSVMRLVAEPAGRIAGGRILFQGRDLLDRYPAGAAPYVRGEAANTVTTYGYDSVTMMQESKVTLCKFTKA